MDENALMSALGLLYCLVLLFFFQSWIWDGLEGKRKKGRGRGQRRGSQFTVMIRAHLQRLIPPHNQPDLAVVPMLEQPHVARTPFLPLPAVAVKLEQLGAHLESLLFLLLVGFRLHLLRQPVDRLEVHVGRFFDFVLQKGGEGQLVFLTIERSPPEKKSIKLFFFYLAPSVGFGLCFFLLLPLFLRFGRTRGFLRYILRLFLLLLFHPAAKH